MDVAREPVNRLMLAFGGASQLVCPELRIDPPREMRKAVLRDDEFACQIEKRVDPRFIDPQRAGSGCPGLLRRWRCEAIDFGIGGTVSSQARDGFVLRRTPGGTTVWRSVVRDSNGASGWMLPAGLKIGRRARPQSGR